VDTGSEARDRPPDSSSSYQYKSWPAKNFVNRGTKKTPSPPSPVTKKRGRKEVLPPPPVEPEEVLPPPPTEPEEVPPPPPDEVKWLNLPRCKVPPPMCAPSVNVDDAYFLVKMLYQAWQSLKKMAIHLGVQ
jgi:hypothetical protein